MTATDAGATTGGGRTVVTRDAATGVVEARLANGLTALVLARPDLPVVSVQTWYRVGSREEDKGRTGLAHFLEHLMFKGTATLRKGDVDLVTMRNGGANNADTTWDRTRYFFHFARDRWERALEIEADRMRGSAFDEREFRAERGPVLEELRRDRDDPWWRLHEAVEATAYHVHPYHNPVIGWVEEVTRVPREDVLAFYHRWYQPSNCTLVVAGGVDADLAVRRIEELFGPIVGTPAPEVRVPEEPPQEGERRFELEMDVQIPRLLAAFHTVRASDPRDTVFDVLQCVLAAGKASRLHERLVRRDRLAASVGAWNDSRRDPGLFMAMLELNDGADRGAAESALWEEFDRLARDGPTEEEVRRAKRQLTAGLVFRLASAGGAAETLGSLHVLAGDWRLFGTLERRIEAVTAAQVRDAAREFFRRSNRTVGWLVPRSGDHPAPQAITAEEVHDLDEAVREAPRPEPAILHRMPPRGGRPLELRVRRTVLANGLRVLAMRREGAPLVAVRAYVEAGMLREAQPGVAALAGQCLDEGAAGRSGQEIATFVESRGASLSTGSLGASLRCLTLDAPDCLDVVRDVLLRPDFAHDVVERKRGELISEFLAENDDPSLIGRERLRAEIYGAHPYGRRDKGSVEALRAISREDLGAHHAAHFVPRNAIVAAVGDLPVEELERLVAERLGAWGDAAPAPVVPPPIPFPETGREVHVEEDREQLHLYLGHLGIRRSDPDYHALLVADVVLGSGPGFTDRLSKRLRDEKGLAYTVFGRIARGSDVEPGTFTAYIGTAPKLRDAALAGMREEIARFVAEGPTGREVEDARSYLLGSYVFGFETADVSAEHLVHLERLGLGFDYPARFAGAIEAVTVRDVHEAVRRHVFPERLIAVLVGRTRA